MAVQYIPLAQQGFGSGADDIQQAAQQALINRQLREKLAEERKTAPARAELLRQQAAWYGDRTQSAEDIAKMRVAAAQQTAAAKAEAVREAETMKAQHAADLQAQKDEATRLRGQDKIEAEAKIKEAELTQKKLEDEVTRRVAEARIEAERAKAALDLATKIPTVKVGGQAYPATRDAEGNVVLDTEGVEAVSAKQSERDQQAAMDAALASRFVKKDGAGTPSKGLFRRALGAIGINTDPEIMQAAPEDKAAFGALLGDRRRALAAGVNPDAFAPYAPDLGVPQSQSLDPYKPVAPTPAALPTPAPAPIPSEDTTARALPAPEPAKAPPAQSSTATTKFSSLPIGAEFVTRDGKRWRKTGPLKTDRELVSEAPSGQ